MPGTTVNWWRAEILGQLEFSSDNYSLTARLQDSDAGGVRRKRVLHVGKYYPPHPGGMETRLRSLCVSVTPWFDCEVIVANAERATRTETIDGVHVRRLATWLMLAGTPICPKMPWAIARARPDLLLLQWPNPAAFVAYAISGYRGPLIVAWESDVIRQRLLDKLFAPVTRAVLARASIILVSSPGYDADSPMLREFARKVRSLPVGISTQRFRRSDDDAISRIRDRYGERIVLGVGRLVYYKGFQHLVRAAKSINGVVVIVGDGPLRTALEDEARKQGVADRVFFPGEVDDLVSYYQACAVFVLPSVARSEAFGIVQLEAMACAKPVVNTRIPTGVPFVSLDGVTGITVPPEDSGALATAINRLLDDAKLRNKYGQAALRRVEEEFSADRVAVTARNIYEEVLGRSAGAVESSRRT